MEKKSAFESYSTPLTVYIYLCIRGRRRRRRALTVLSAAKARLGPFSDVFCSRFRKWQNLNYVWELIKKHIILIFWRKGTKKELLIFNNKRKLITVSRVHFAFHIQREERPGAGVAADAEHDMVHVRASHYCLYDGDMN